MSSFMKLGVYSHLLFHNQFKTLSNYKFGYYLGNTLIRETFHTFGSKPKLILNSVFNIKCNSHAVLSIYMVNICKNKLKLTDNKC